MIFIGIVFIILSITFNIILGFIGWILYKYIDFKYFSELEIIALKEENKYLKEENKKVNGTSTDFWGDN